MSALVMEHYFSSTFLTVLNMDEHGGESKRLDHHEGTNELKKNSWRRSTDLFQEQQQQQHLFAKNIFTFMMLLLF